MKKWAQKDVVIWLSPHAIHIIKKEYDWLHRCRIVLGDTYAEIHNARWMEEKDTIQAVLQHVLEIYDLCGWSLSLVLSGPLVLWQLCELPAESDAEGREAVVWSEPLAGKETEYIFDICRIRKSDGQDMHPWILGAYPRFAIETVCKAANDAGLRVRNILLLPGIINNQYAGTDGTFFLQEYKDLHVMEIKEGVVISYAFQQGAISQVDSTEWFRMNVKEIATQNLCQPVWQKKTEQFQHKWHIQGPPSLLGTI